MRSVLDFDRLHGAPTDPEGRRRISTKTLRKSIEEIKQNHGNPEYTPRDLHEIADEVLFEDRQAEALLGPAQQGDGGAD